MLLVCVPFVAAAIHSSFNACMLNHLLLKLVYEKFPHTSCTVLICFGDNGVDSSTISYILFVQIPACGIL